MSTQTTRTTHGRPRTSVARAVTDIKETLQNGRIYHFAYMIRPREGRKLLPHQVRDSVAAMLTTNVLHTQGFGCSIPIFNYPMPYGTPTIEVDDSFLRRQDLLLLTGRPPMDDENWPLKRGMARSHTSLEEKVFAVLRPYFHECARSHVALAAPFIRVCPPAVVEKSKIEFFQNGGASYRRFAGGPEGWCKPEHERTTAAYMIFEPETWPGGPKLLALFAMGGPETLGWAHIIHSRFSHLVCVPGFVMAEMITTPAPDWMSDLSFVDEWQVELLSGDSPITPNPGPLPGSGLPHAGGGGEGPAAHVALA
jgi:hypothetical protein